MSFVRQIKKNIWKTMVREAMAKAEVEAKKKPEPPEVTAEIRPAQTPISSMTQTMPSLPKSTLREKIGRFVKGLARRRP